MDQPITKKTRRARAPRSSTGCRTCRTRRVKCDEAPGSCQRCISAGFKCDGYDQERLSHRRGINTFATMALADCRFRILLPDKSPEERRFFNYFHSVTVPMMNGWMGQRVWNASVLQMSQSEPALCHAVVALSSLQEISEIAGQPVLLEDINNRTHRFALYQYNRSISHLATRMKSNDPQVKSMVLLCCLLYVAFELIRGKIDRAIIHIQNGMQILGAKKLDYHALYSAHPAQKHDMEKSLAAAMMHLDFHAAHFDQSQTHPPLDIPALAEGQSSGPTDIQCESIEDAYFIRDRYFLQFCLFTRSYDSLSDAEIATSYHILRNEQRKQQMHYNNFGQALNDLEKRMIAQRSLTTKDSRSLEVLRMHQTGCALIVEVSLIRSKEIIQEIYASRFSQIVDMGERIVAGFKENARDSGLLPTLLMETAVLSPLYYIIEKCCNPPIAERALRVIESWPHREGLWDSTMVGTLARAAIETYQ
ncbi:Zn(II)2Cys6 transcription factor [Aspergillus stella-maris]|uniref:Zn(II)2Cys6 transcription factor n=1 Tax=Aspergillus stella-maris TaxID=1810926 RepID=UPI003CCCCD8F